MRIGGFVKNSLIDWEGKVVSVIFTKGCNFRCGYCHNPALVIPELMNKEYDFSISGILSALEERKAWIDGVVITGGEPTIHNDLPELIIQIKKFGLCIKLDTNGTNPLMVKDLIDERLIDGVSMDIKTIIEDTGYSHVTGCRIHGITDRITETIAILRNSGIQYQFRTTVIPDYHTEEILERLKKEFADDPYVLQPFRKGVTIDSYKK